MSWFILLLKDEPDPSPDDLEEQLLDDREDKVQDTDGSVPEMDDRIGRASVSPNNSSLVSSENEIRSKTGQSSIA